MSNVALLRLHDVHKSFSSGHRQLAVLSGVELQLREGELLALVGTSGSGKSTLLNLIAGLEYPDRGRIEMLGQELSRFSDHQRTLFRRRHIGIVFQSYNLVPTLTVNENLLLPLQLNRLPGSAALATELLRRLGMADCGALLPEQLSGGEQQRVAIGRALIHRPSLLLADEPTGSLDNETAARVTELLFEQLRERRQSLILVTHNEALAAQADRVVRLHQGVLSDAGAKAAAQPGAVRRR